MITRRPRFLAHRMEGLVDAPCGRALRQVGEEVVEALIVRTLETQPAGATHWSTRAMTRQVGMSQVMVSRISRAFELQPAAPRPLSCRAIPPSSTKYATWLASTLTHRIERSCCASTRSRRSRLSRVPRRCFPCAPAKSSATATTTSATAPRICLPPST